MISFKISANLTYIALYFFTGVDSDISASTSSVRRKDFT